MEELVLVVSRTVAAGQLHDGSVSRARIRDKDVSTILLCGSHDWRRCIIRKRCVGNIELGDTGVGVEVDGNF